MDKVTKERYGQEYEDAQIKIQEIINDIDPVGLMGICPADEYSPEINTILPRLRDCDTEDDITQMVIEVFIEWFDESSVNQDRLKNAGKRLIPVKKAYTWLNR